MNKTRVLFVGSHPAITSGNGNMMASVLEQLDIDKYFPAVFANRPPATMDAFAGLDFQIVTPSNDNIDQSLVNYLQTLNFDILCMVGVDVWQYGDVMPHIKALQQRKQFKWAWIFPFDIQEPREDWNQWINMIDFPCVYSLYGYDTLVDHVPNLVYFRPPLLNREEFYPCPNSRLDYRRNMFSTISNDQFLFGYVGRNQMRKDLAGLIEGYLQAKHMLRDRKDIMLYLHTDQKDVWNIPQLVLDNGGNDSDVICKYPGSHVTAETMAKIYNSLDCLANCSMQEGLAWTPLEAMLCGTPTILTQTTSQTELTSDGVHVAGHMVNCHQDTFVQVRCSQGPSVVKAKRAYPGDIATAMVSVADDPEFREREGEACYNRALKWLQGVSDINQVLSCERKEEAVSVTKKIPAILFVQHSSAGDVLMSTQCFKGIKEKIPNKSLVYMTQKQFQGIVKDHPLIDKVIDWDTSNVQKYEFVFNPHGTKILPGGWNNLDVKLYSMYPYFCNVEADDIYINQAKPKLDLLEEYICVHTTGGQREYRHYKHMQVVVKFLQSKGHKIVQVGAKSDYVCGADMDARGVSFNEAAWIIKHSQLSICVDSFVSHLSGAMGVPTIVLYGPAPARVVGPRMQGDQSKLIELQPNMLDVCGILHHCWGNPPPGKQKCTSPCINSISPVEVFKVAEQLLEKA